MDKVLLPFLFLIVAAGLYFSYMQPAYDVLQALWTQEERLDTAVKDAETLQAKLDALLVAYNGFDKESLRRLNQLLPEKVDSVRTIIQTDALARKNGLEITSFELPQGTVADTTDDVKAVQKATFTMECNGSYQNLKSFLKELEKSLTLFDVSSLVVNVEGKGTNTQTDKNTNVLKNPSYTITMELPWLPA
ncbi:MAG: type 4a pilus biogenesis protein PilO [Candidatus Pacebacteria bacterium]|nr:type 4a pilus biogenesis protein PilO [Candidatus Paceibacterota bacterium]